MKVVEQNQITSRLLVMYLQNLIYSLQCHQGFTPIFLINCAVENLAFRDRKRMTICPFCGPRP
jgi:hypothetical protein